MKEPQELVGLAVFHEFTPLVNGSNVFRAACRPNPNPAPFEMGYSLQGTKWLRKQYESKHPNLYAELETDQEDVKDGKLKVAAAIR